MNNKTKSLPQREIVKSLRFFIAPEMTLEYFRTYLQKLQKAIFLISKQIKSPSHEDEWPQYISVEKAKLLGYRNELHTLGATLANYAICCLAQIPIPTCAPE